MPSLSRSTVFTGYLSGATGPVTVGTCLLFNAAATRLIVATDANRTATGRKTAGIALTAGSDTDTRVEVQFCGPVPPSISGLGSGTASSIYVNSSGVLARGSGSEADVVGRCDTDGTAYILCGSLSSLQGPAGENASLSGTVATDLLYVIDDDPATLGAVGAWTRPSSGRLNATTGGYLSWGAVGDTLPSPPNTPAGFLKLGSSIGASGQDPYGIVQWYRASDDRSRNLWTVHDNGNGTATINFGGFTAAGADGTFSVNIQGGSVSLISGDAGGELRVAGAASTDSDRKGALCSTRFAIGTNGSSNDATFGGTAAGPMLKLHRVTTEPTGNPTAVSGPAVWIWLANPTTSGIKIKFPSGNILVLPDANATVATVGGTETLTNKTLTAPTMSDPVLSGTVTHNGTRSTTKAVPTAIQTSATTQVNCGTYTLTDDTTVAIDVIVWSARQSSNSKRGRWKFSAVVSRNGGDAVLDQLVVGDAFNSTAATVTCDVSGNDFRVRVTPADTDARNFWSELSIHEGTDAA